MDIQKDIKVTLDKLEVNVIRDLVELGLQRLEEVDKKAWGDKYRYTKELGQSFLEKTNLK